MKVNMMWVPTRVPLLLALLFSSLHSQSTSASRDSDYYYPGFTNPLTEEYPLYWKDSVNVLQDLDQFQALYVKYHHCVWSKYGRGYGNGQNYDEQGNDQEDYDLSYQNGCGGYGAENFWYMGRTQCFKANAAFSLYGVLKGDESGGEKKGTYCHKDSYINSFFTTYGVESFAGPLGLGVDKANSYCSSQAPNDGSNAQEYVSDAAWDDDYLDDGFVFYNYKAYTSYGTGCSADGAFVQDMYQGAFCHGRNRIDTLNTLQDFNQALENVDCMQIYNANGNNGQDDGERNLEEGEGEDEGQQQENGQDYYENYQENDDYQDMEFDQMDAYQLLEYSKSCSLRQYPNDCPDPFGKKKRYAEEMRRALEGVTGSQRDRNNHVAQGVSAGLVLVAMCFCFLAYQTRKRRLSLVAAKNQQRSPEKQRKFGRLFKKDPQKEDKSATATVMSEEADHAPYANAEEAWEDEPTDVEGNTSLDTPPLLAGVTPRPPTPPRTFSSEGSTPLPSPLPREGDGTPRSMSGVVEDNEVEGTNSYYYQYGEGDNGQNTGLERPDGVEEDAAQAPSSPKASGGGKKRGVMIRVVSSAFRRSGAKK